MSIWKSLDRIHKMQYSSTISLVVKVIDSEIFEDMGEVGKDGRATGCEISVHCLGADECGKIFNVNIRTSVATCEEAGKITEKLSCNSIHFVQGVFLLGSDENYDIITVYDPSYEAVGNDKVSLYSRQLNQCNCKKGEYLYRSAMT
jgi:hypothetical protein